MSSVPKLSRELIARSRVIARGRGIRDVNRLVETYGGLASEWMKKSTTLIIIEGRPAEIHWYECHGVGKVEQKVKWI